MEVRVFREHCMDIGVSILLFEVSENMGLYSSHFSDLAIFSRISRSLADFAKIENSTVSDRRKRLTQTPSGVDLYASEV
jgi:hypothetical protein